MTRINADIPPKELTRVHLIAELREIIMVPASLRRSLRTRSPEAVHNGIPKKFTLNRGHVSFYYDKMTFLYRRFHLLCDEMEYRGYSPDRSRENAFFGFDPIWDKDWVGTIEDRDLVKSRIALRIKEKPHLYKGSDELRYYGLQTIGVETVQLS